MNGEINCIYCNEIDENYIINKNNQIVCSKCRNTYNQHNQFCSKCKNYIRDSILDINNGELFHFSIVKFPINKKFKYGKNYNTFQLCTNCNNKLEFFLRTNKKQ